MTTPITIHPDNPHYFLFRGKPTILITSAEHYGAVINLDFDYTAYLDVLAKYGMNATRIYTGAYVEPEHYFLRDNTLGPRIGRYCLPWGRSDTPGYALGGNLLDLDVWNADYFDRLHDFLAQAGARGIVVEICLFNAMYPDTWERMPLYHTNNVQGISACACKDFQTLHDAALVTYQERYVRKITQAAAAFDNVILEVCDEPGIHGTTPAEYGPWLSRLVDVIVETERAIPQPHLIAQQVCGPLGGAGDFSADRRVSVITGQYIGATSGEQVGGMQLLDSAYAHNKPIELNETAYYPIWYEGDTVAASRVEAWEYVVGGGASFNQLNGLFSTFNPTASGTEIDILLDTLRNLRNFMYSFDFLRMQPDASMVRSINPRNTYVRGMCESGVQYALYLHHSTLKEGGRYTAQTGNYRTVLNLSLSSSKFDIEYINPANGQVIQTESKWANGSGEIYLFPPPYAVDIALRIRRVGHMVAQSEQGSAYDERGAS